MFDGEFASLEAMAATKTVRVPQPIKVGTQQIPLLAHSYLGSFKKYHMDM